MRFTVLHMLSTNSLQAFSGAATTSPLNRPGPVRLVREQQDQKQAAPSQRPALPNAMPALPPPRGSLLNLSI